MSRPMQMVLGIVVALALGGGGFVAGMNVAASSPKTGGTAAVAPSPSGAAARRGPGGEAGQQVTGRVLSVGDNSITVEVRQPGNDQARSIIALVGGNARIVRSTETEIKASDIKVGDQVLVVGQTDATTGAVSANAVVVGVNVLQQLFGGGGQNGAGASGTPRRATPTPTPAR